MTREEAIERLRGHEAELRKLGVAQLVLFGSTARDEAGEGSDFFFDYEKGKLGLFGLVEAMEFAAEILGVRTDMTRDSLHQMLRPKIEAAAVQVS